MLEAPVEATASPGACQDDQPRAFLVDEGVVGLHLRVELHDVLDQLQVLLVENLLDLVLGLGELDISDEVLLFLQKRVMP